MNVVAVAEGLDEVGIPTEVCHDAQLYLTVIGTEEEFALIGYERLAHLLAQSVTHRYVLQVRVAA